MDMAVIIILTLCVVGIIPWMIRKDFEKRMLSTLRKEIAHNMEQLREYIREVQSGPCPAQGPDEAQLARPLILQDEVFRRIQQVDFRSKGLTDADKELLEKVFAESSRVGLSASGSSDHQLCAQNAGILEDVLSRLTAYSKG